jgi:hypothetical protein
MERIDRTLEHEIVSMEDSDDWQLRVIAVGGILGAVIGLLTSYLLVRTSRENRNGPPAISTGDALKVGITTIGLVRAIASLGDRKK